MVAQDCISVRRRGGIDTLQCLDEGTCLLLAREVHQHHLQQQLPQQQELEEYFFASSAFRLASFFVADE
jgi:hypothetical protein